MLKFQVRFITIAIFITLAAVQTAPAQTILARDDHHEWTDAAIKELLTQEGDTLADKIMAAASDPDSPFRQLLQQQAENLAYMTAFVAQQQSKPLPSETQWVLKRQLWDWSEARLNQEVAENIDLSTPTLLQVYDKNKYKYYVEERRQIAVLYKAFPASGEQEATLQQMKQWRERPDINENFLDYVRKHSDLPGASQNPILPAFKRGTYGPILEINAFGTPEGEVSPVFSATKGTYLVKVLDVIPEGYAPLSEVRGLVAGQVQQEKLPAAKDERLAPLRQQAKAYQVNAPSKLSGDDSVILQVNDFKLTWGELKKTDPDLAQQIESGSSAADEALNRLAGWELYWQHLESKAKADPAKPESLAVNIFRTRKEYLLRLYLHLDSQITVEEEELTAYYEQFKEFYHAPAPRRFSVLEARFPSRAGLTEPLYFKEIEQLKREMDAVYPALAKSPEDFDQAARAWADKRPRARVYQTELLEEFPKDWKVAKPYTSFGLGMVSSIEQTSQAFLIFRVVEVGKPRVLPYDEVRDKVYRVIRGGKETKIIKDDRDAILKKINFRMAWPEVTSSPTK